MDGKANLIATLALVISMKLTICYPSWTGVRLA